MRRRSIAAFRVLVLSSRRCDPGQHIAVTRGDARQREIAPPDVLPRRGRNGSGRGPPVGRVTACRSRVREQSRRLAEQSLVVVQMQGRAPCPHARGRASTSRARPTTCDAAVLVHCSTCFAATRDGPDPCRRKSHSSNAALISSALWTMATLGNRFFRISSTPLLTLDGHSRTSASGRYFSSNVNAPGVWAMSPMLTVCHEDRWRIRGLRFCTAGATAAAARARLLARNSRRWCERSEREGNSLQRYQGEAERVQRIFANCPTPVARHVPARPAGSSRSRSRPYRPAATPGVAPLTNGVARPARPAGRIVPGWVEVAREQLRPLRGGSPWPRECKGGTPGSGLGIVMREAADPSSPAHGLARASSDTVGPWSG
jgi:hypothetical protein